MLSAFQETLALLATDARFRARFAERGEPALDPFELDDEERSALAAIPREALDRYAHSLIAKRWGELSRTVPLTLRVAPRIERIYRRWVAEHPASAVDTVLAPGPAEGLRALPALAAHLSSGQDATYAADLLVYEVLACCSRSDGARRSLASRFALHEIATDVRRGLLPVDVEE